MSDNIVINITPSPPDPINVNVSTSPENISVQGSLYGVISVNGKTGVVVLTKDDLGLGNVDNTSDWLKPISLATLTALESFSLVLASSSLWNSVYSTVRSNSANWNAGYNSSIVVQNKSPNWDIAYQTSTVVQNNSSFWGGSDQVFNAFLTYLSTTPLVLSSTDTKGKILSGGVDLFDIFSTSFVGSQTLIYTPSSYSLTISNGNTVNLSSINATFASNSSKYESVYSSVFSSSANWQSTYSTVQNNSAQWFVDNTIDLGIRALSGNWQSTYNTVCALSTNWNFAYGVATYVQTNSANWEESGSVIPTISQYLSTTVLTLCTIDTKGQILSAGIDLFDIFLTSESDSQTLTYINSSYSLSISNGNTVNLSSINTTFATNSAKYESVYSIVLNNSSSWEESADVIPTVVYHLSTNSITLCSIDTKGKILSAGKDLFDIFLTSESDSQTLFYVESSYQLGITKGNVINLSSINATFTLNSAKYETVFNTVCALSTNWNRVYSTVFNVSANWNSVFSSVCALSTNWNRAYNFVFNTSANSNTVFNTVCALSANWNSVYTTVRNISSNWNTDNSIDLGIRALSGNWQSSYITVSTLSANWQSVYTTVLNTSANWNIDNSIDLGVRALSANWQSTYIGVCSLSANWQSVYATVLNVSANWNVDNAIDLGIRALSGNWESTYNTVCALSANWNSVYSSVQNISANWNEAYQSSTIYQINSSTYATNNFVNSNFLNLTGGTIAGNLYILSSLYVLGSAVFVNVEDLTVKDPIIYIAEGNQTDILDIGVMGAWTNAPGYPDGYQHGGLVRRSDNKIWTLFSGATAEPLSSINVDWHQLGILLEPLSAKFYGDIYGNRNVYGSLTINGSIRGNDLTVSGNVSSSGILYGQAQDSTLSTTSTNTVQNSAVTAALQLLSPAPTYTSPSLSLTNFSPSTFEIGATVSRSLTQSWTQNDAGSLTGSILRKNSTTIASYGSLPQTYTVSESAVLGTTTYQMSASYGSGIIKNNVLGFPDPRGRITAGSATTSQSYIGYYRRWIGSWPSIPSNANDLRTISLSTSLDTNTTLASQASPIYINNKFILVVIPSTRTLVSVVTEANENLTTQFTLSSVQIQDAGGTGRPYKLYYLETALPLNANLTTATIS